MRLIQQFKKFFSLFFLISFASLSWYQKADEVDRLSFDALFPKTWYTKAAESCAQVWGALDELAVRPLMVPPEKTMMADIAVGRLVFAQFCLDLLIQSPDAGISGDDVSYLIRLMEAIDERFVKVSDSLERDRAYCLQQVVTDLKKKVSLLQTKDAAISTDH